MARHVSEPALTDVEDRAKTSQARLLANPGLMADVDEFAASPDLGVRHGRPQQR